MLKKLLTIKLTIVFRIKLTIVLTIKVIIVLAILQSWLQQCLQYYNHAYKYNRA